MRVEWLKSGKLASAKMAAPGSLFNRVMKKFVNVTENHQIRKPLCG